jgi:excisionase family DNA binding protein
MSETDESNKLVVTINEAAARLSCSRDFIEKLCAQGELTRIKLSNRKIVIRVSELLAPLERRTQAIAA